MVNTTKTFMIQAVFSIGLLTGSTHSELSLKAVKDCYEGRDSGFKHLEFVFIEQPKAELQSQSSKVQATILGLISTYVLASSVVQQTTEKSKNTPAIVGKIGATALLGKIAFDYYCSILDQQIKHATLVKFLTNWKFHRQYVPTQLISAFDELALSFEASKSKTLTSGQVSEIFAIIQHLIEHEFAKRYEKDKMKAMDTLGTLKTITDISKNLN